MLEPLQAAASVEGPGQVAELEAHVPTPSDDWVSIANAADWTGMSKDRLYRLMRAGHIRRRRDARRWLVSWDSVLDYLGVEVPSGCTVPCLKRFMRLSRNPERADSAKWGELAHDVYDYQHA